MSMFCDVGRMFSLLLSLLASLTPVLRLYLGLCLSSCAADCLFSTLFTALSFFSRSSFCFFSCFSLSLLRTSSSVNITANLVLIVAGARWAWAETGTGGGGAKTDDTVSTTTVGEEETTGEEEDESNIGAGIRGTGGATIRDESSFNPRCNTPSLYIFAVIFVRSKGHMPAFANPLMILLRGVALTHAAAVAAAICCGFILLPCSLRQF